jgi:hypothetical protein
LLRGYVVIQKLVVSIVRIEVGAINTCFELQVIVKLKILTRPLLLVLRILSYSIRDVEFGLGADIPSANL